MSFVDALDNAIGEHQDLIEGVVADYRNKMLHWKDETINIWRIITIPSKYRCDWFTKTECGCERNTCSLQKTYRKRFCFDYA